jgi:hypothetical protein
MEMTGTTKKYLALLNERSATLLLVLLLGSDLVFFVLHFVSTLTPLLSNPMFNLSEDRGYPEFFQYLKYLWIVLLLLYPYSRNTSLRFGAWAMVFAYFLLDDSMQIHERGGLLISGQLELISYFGLRARDYGELIVSATVGVLLLPSLVWAYRTGTQTFKRTSLDLFLLICLLIFFGVVVDMLHVIVGSNLTAEYVFGVVEDGGEMLAASLILWYVFLLRVRNDQIGCHLYDLVRSALPGRFAG